jgi:hypothetical protein
MGIENYELPISNYECDHLHFSICDYLREPICFFLADQRWSFSRWFTPIYFLRPSAISICEYLRELFFLNFLTHAPDKRGTAEGGEVLWCNE